jgi:hypothetical protein
MNSRKSSLFAAALALTFTLPAQASNAGLDVTGTLSFGDFGQYWSNQNAVIGSGAEYVYQDSANVDVANFSGTQLKISDLAKIASGNWEMTFSTPTGFDSLSLVSSDFTPGLTYSLNAGTIVINWAGTSSPGLFHAVFDVSAVPEPGTSALMLAGVVAVGFVARRRKG